MKIDINDPRLTSYALGELDEREQRDVESLLAGSPEARAAVEEIRQTADWVESELKAEPVGALTNDQRASIESAMMAKRITRWMPMAMAASLFVIVGIWLSSPTFYRAGKLPETSVALRDQSSISEDSAPKDRLVVGDSRQKKIGGDSQESRGEASTDPVRVEASAPDDLLASANPEELETVERTVSEIDQGSAERQRFPGQPAPRSSANSADLWNTIRANNATPKQSLSPLPSTSVSPPAQSALKGLGYVNSARSTATGVIPGPMGDDEDFAPGHDFKRERQGEWRERPWPPPPPRQIGPNWSPQPNTEDYAKLNDNPFFRAREVPLSTFSIDVDTASYANVRRFLTSGSLPPPDAVRIEEMINYFSYDYPQPTGEDPFSVNIDTATCPWQTSHKLLRVGLKGKTFPQEVRPPCNLVFLIDVSGSMEPENKLPLLKRAMGMLTSQLRVNDRVAIVVYAGNSGLVLPSTTCNNQGTIQQALANLEAGGSTNGGAGIQLAYSVAAEHFNKEGVNRVILCTDGDFNVGVTSQNELVSLIEEKARTGVFLSVFGFGMGNLKDSTLEKLADKGNGNYGYIDTLSEARKVFVEQLSGTLVTIAKDVKIQIEFNSAQVQAYRLIGYENRLMAAQDFNDDRKDAGEIGAGHTVTALYELVPNGVSMAGVDSLKYQQAPQEKPAAVAERPISNELLTVKLRYKQPDGATSKLIERPFTGGGEDFSQASIDFRFAAAVASFGMLLRSSPHSGDASFDSVLQHASASLGADLNGYRTEFVELVRKTKSMKRN